MSCRCILPFVTGALLGGAACHGSAGAPSWLVSFRPHPGCASIVRSRPATQPTGTSLLLRAAAMSDGTPIEGAEFRVTEHPVGDSLGSSWQRANEGSALLLSGLEARTYTLEARRLGYTLRRETVSLVEGTEISVVLMMNDDPWSIRCQPPRYRLPDEPACVGSSEPEAKQVLEHAMIYAAPTESPLPELPTFQSSDVALVLDEATCERAARAYGGSGSPPRRVVVIRLGSAGFFVEDPFEPHRAGEFSLTVVYDSKWRPLFSLAG